MTSYIKREAKKNHAQFYTKDTLGDLLISLIPSNCDYKNIIDLSAGEGALLEAAGKHFKESKTVAFDIDNNNISKILACTKHQSYSIDSTTYESLQLAQRISKDYCLALGNPPFKSISNTKYITNLFKEFSIDINTKTVRAEIVFILQSIKLLKKNGIIAFILPDGILTNSKFKYVRELISKKMCLLLTKEIPPASFTGTEARTHILIIKKTDPIGTVKLYSFDSELPCIKISSDQFCARGDYKYYCQPRPINTVELNDLCILIKRGTSKFREINSTIPTIHTTHLKSSGLTLKNECQATAEYKNLIAKENDILLARVGTRVIGRFKVVSKGLFLVTDCVTIIRPKNIKCRDLIIKTLQSDVGRSWLHSAAKGVGALHLTVEEIKKIPIFV